MTRTANQPNRRTILKVVAGASGAVAGVTTLSAEAAVAAPEGSAVIVGDVVSATAEALHVKTSRGITRVTATPGARMYSGLEGLVSDLGKFVAGDRVAAQGRLVSGELTATSVGSILHPLTVNVDTVAANGSEARTDAGRIKLNAGRLPDYSHSTTRRIAAGDSISGLSWRNPKTGETSLVITDSGQA